jgi:hypothetical protein
MERIYPKKPHDIHVQVTHQKIKDGVLNDAQDVAVVPLNTKLYEYAVRIGGTMAGILVQLFTDGKVRIDFGTHTERLELVDKDDRLSGPDAMRLFDEFIASIEKTGVQLFKKATQQIFVQLEKATRPTNMPRTMLG